MASSTYTKKNGETDRLLNKKGNDYKTVQISDDESEDNKESSHALAISFVLMIVFQLGNRIFGRLVVYPMHNYPLFMNLSSTLMYVPVCFAYIIPMLMFTNSITKEQQDISKYKFAVMGGYDSVSGIMSTFAINYITSSSIIVLVQQSAIPISMIISKITLNSTYTKNQYLGASIVMFGIVVVLIPTFLAPADAAPGSGSPMMQLVWIMVMVLSCVPMCLSSVYKEKALGEAEIDCTYLNGWVAVFQSLIAIPLCIPSAAVQQMPVSNIMPNLYGGLRCSFGLNTITESYNPFNQPLDDCTAAPFYVSTYFFFNIVYNFLIVVIIKYGSANILWLASTVIVPLSNVAFSLKFMPGSQPLKVWDIVGLVVIMAGLVVYRFMEQIYQLIDFLHGVKDDVLEANRKRLSKKIAKRVERKQMNYVGFNQLESLQPLVDTRVQREQVRSLFKSPMQIRNNYLVSLGIPPSPSGSSRNTSPAINERQQQAVGMNLHMHHNNHLVKHPSFKGRPPTGRTRRANSLSNPQETDDLEEQQDNERL